MHSSGAIKQYSLALSETIGHGANHFSLLDATIER
jgi:hypothetical protein